MLDGTYQNPDRPEPPRKLEGWPRYLVVIGIAYVVASLVLALVGIASFQSINQTVRTQDQKIEQLQVDTNDNLCNQSEYSAGNTCQGGDGNG
jgi:hypothetical protein